MADNSQITRDFTATTFVVHADCTLLLLHRKLAMWLPPGGHIDPHELPHDAAVREVREETGLEVALRTTPTPLGDVLVLPQPHCILLENITPGHQHIDLIYVATVVAGTLSPSARETNGARWVNWDDLAAPEIAHDICVLGRQAIALVRSDKE
jgi:8-oxo-dGTP pyrophosphatase MutT (NUDIX family)